VSVTSRLDDFQRRHPGAGFPLAVLYKYVDDSGGYLAALIAYYAFVSLFPLLLLATTILGFVLGGDPAAQRNVLQNAAHEFPVIGSQLVQSPAHVGGGTGGVVIGLLGALYGGLGVSLAAQNAMNTAWRVPRNNRPNPIKARARGLLLLCTVGLAVLGTSALSALTVTGGALGAWWRAVVLIVSVALNAGVFILAFRIATARRLSVRDVAPGAVAAALAWQLLQSFGTLYVDHVVRRASAVNSVFALVLGLLSFLYLAAVVVVLCVEANAVHVDKLWPRALLTPLTDDVDLTRGDERAYTDQAQAQRAKGFQQIDVTFDKR
jgi:YihY family inner membrane protein